MTTESQRADDSSHPTPNSASAEPDVRSHRGSLRSKLVLSLGGIFIVFLTVDEMVRQRVIEPEFVALEKAGAVRDASRVLAALNAEVEHLSDLAKHGASSLQDTGPTAMETVSSDAKQSRRNWPSKNLDWAVHIARDGSWRWLHRGQNAGGNDVKPGVGKHLRTLVSICKTSANKTSAGMTRIGDDGLVLYAIVALDEDHTDDSSVPGRYLVVGRTIDEVMVTELRRQTQVEFSLQSPRTTDPTKKLVVWEADESTLVVEVQLTGVNDERLANVYIQVPRDITARAIRTSSLARNSFIFGSVAALLMLLLLLQRIVIGPLTAIREHSNRVAEEGLETQPLVLSENDEIGQLARAFDKMVGRLSDAQNQLTHASQAAGRSQVASTVIHNVGNVLTNVNSLLDAASDRVQGLRISPLDKLSHRLKQADADDGLLAATPDYLEGLAGSLKSDQQSLGELLSTLNDNIRHIHDVIRDQQRHTDKSTRSDSVMLTNVIGEAISCCRARLDQDSVDVEVTGELAIQVKTDRSLVLQTMINIIGNARHAMRDNAGSRTLHISVNPSTESVRISIRDNGCGMCEETLQKAFDAHFTRREGGTGLGLHFCALTLKRLGGQIEARSEGPGQGSTFVVELPRPSPHNDETPLTYEISNAAGAES